jgi:hypothetical protein
MFEFAADAMIRSSIAAPVGPPAEPPAVVSMVAEDEPPERADVAQLDTRRRRAGRWLRQDQLAREPLALAV